MICILMGVTGSGKSTIGALLAEKLAWQFCEGDDFHGEANKEKMRSGIPLTDDDRTPWLLSLRDEIARFDRTHTNAVITCSALKQSYRDILKDNDTDIIWIYLKGKSETIATRLQKREGHFMNPLLLKSQFETLEEPTDALTISTSVTPAEIVDIIIAYLNLNSTEKL